MPLESFLSLTSLSTHLFPLYSKWRCPLALASEEWCGLWRGPMLASGGLRSVQGCGRSSSARTRTGRWDCGCAPSTTWVSTKTHTCSCLNYSASLSVTLLSNDHWGKQHPVYQPEFRTQMWVRVCFLHCRLEISSILSNVKVVTLKPFKSTTYYQRWRWNPVKSSHWSHDTNWLVWFPLAVFSGTFERFTIHPTTMKRFINYEKF